MSDSVDRKLLNDVFDSHEDATETMGTYRDALVTLLSDLLNRLEVIEAALRDRGWIT